MALQSDSPSLWRRIPPLGRELRRVFIEHLFGIDSVAHERPAAEVVNEQVMRHGQLEPGPARPFGEVVVVEEARVRTVRRARRWRRTQPFHEQAEAGELGNSEPLPAMFLAAIAGRNAVISSEVAGKRTSSTNCGGAA